MNNLNQRVVGSYEDDKETKRVIRHLLNQGFNNNQLTIYTNEENHPFDSGLENVQVAQPETGAEKNGGSAKEDKNFWESIRDAFQIRKDHDFDNKNHKSVNDLLKPYRQDLKKGFYVVAVDDSNERSRSNSSSDKKDSTDVEHKGGPDPELETLGTAAGFPNEGSVQGMGDGKTPPVASHSKDGTPPELEDTAAKADEEEATDVRLSQTRHEDHTK
ncbi:general stress protein [Alkalibacterium kapii]|uniref:Uncharacterized protein n=1 Tax=Alkalibacterium kapii TaxID=426704 RepID=A0A511AWY7_9LACT|nr:general stress protein [Alkalibacterium kapii]GEK91631.1 hypothetical protein AKA01nite_12530 [Alkalibacterium kapii]